MNATEARHLTVGAVVVTGVLVSVHSIAQGHAPAVRTFLGLGVAGTVLALLADTAPDLAGSFAALLLVSAVLVSGGAAFADLSKGLKP